MPYRPAPGIAVYHVRVDDYVVMAAEHDLAGPLLASRPSGPMLMRASDNNGDFPLCSAIFQVAYGLGDFGERIRLAHDGSDVTGLDLLTQRFEVSLALVSARDEAYPKFSLKKYSPTAAR